MRPIVISRNPRWACSTSREFVWEFPENQKDSHLVTTNYLCVMGPQATQPEFSFSKEALLKNRKESSGGYILENKQKPE